MTAGQTFQRYFSHPQAAPQYAPATPGGNVTVGMSPVLLAGARPGRRVSTCVNVVNGGVAIYLGGAGVSASNGAQLGPGATLPVMLFAGDQVWAITAAGASAVSVLVT